MASGGGIFLLDGAAGTELDRRGVDVSLPLWSARALIDAPQVVRQIHLDYFRAGADAAVTVTFRTHRRSLAKGSSGERAKELTLLAVQLAREARDEVNPEGKVFGSVAPLEDCYHPELAPSERECQSEHEQMISQLLEGGVDTLLIETIGTQREALGAAAAACALAPERWMISFCLKADGPPGLLLDGSPVLDVLPRMSEAKAVGVNCVAAPALPGQVRLLRAMVGGEQQVIAYGNVGEVNDEGNWVETDAADPGRYAEYARQWVKAGATMVGGCCGTTPETIRAVAEVVRG